jgi:hypothetical protein
MPDQQPALVAPGDFIPGTQLRRRFQADREVCPEYCTGPQEMGSHAVDAACQQATASGWRAFLLWGLTFGQFGGEWYALSGGARRG